MPIANYQLPIANCWQRTSFIPIGNWRLAIGNYSSTNLYPFGRKMPGCSTLWAVHINDGVLNAPVLFAGLAVAAGLAVLGAWRLRDEEVPRVALLTAAFFLASQVHVRVGPTTVHLLLNGLVGVLLGWRATLAIPIGLLLQAVLFLHGGFLTLGVNSCVMGIPALAAGFLFGLLRRFPWKDRAWFRALLVGLSVSACTLSLVYSVTLLLERSPLSLATNYSWKVTFHPLTLGITLGLVLVAVGLEQRYPKGSGFALGLVVGLLTVLATITLNCLVLIHGGEEYWTYPALILFLVHVPIAVIEGIVLGFTVGFLERVKPEMLGRPERACRSEGSCEGNS